MRIALDCSHHLIPGGIRAYIENILGALARAEPENEYLLYYRRLRRPAATVPLPEGTKARAVFVRAPRRILSSIENSLGLPPVEWWTGGIDVFHGTHFSLPAARRARLVLTVHDAAYLRDPSFYSESRGNEYGYRYLLGRSLRRAELVLAISNSTRRDLMEIFGIEGGRIWVVPYGADPRFRPLGEGERGPILERLGISRPYVLYPVGTMDARKNLARTLQAFAAAFPRREERPLLFLAGVGAASRAILEAASRLGLGDDIAIRQARYPDELMALLSGALWGMYLSLYEGFGLPPLEAMACGLPMVASNAASVPEVVGDAALLVDPSDVEAIALSMRRLHEDRALREELGRIGRLRATSEAFSWERAARQTLAAYRGDRDAYEALPQPLLEREKASAGP